MDIFNKPEFEIEIKRADGKSFGLVNANHINLSLRGDQPYELLFHVPEYIEDSEFQPISNPYYDTLRVNFYATITFEDTSIDDMEFVLEKLSQSTDGGVSSNVWLCYLNNYEMSDKKILNWDGVEIQENIVEENRLVSSDQLFLSFIPIESVGLVVYKDGVLFTEVEEVSLGANNYYVDYNIGLMKFDSIYNGTTIDSIQYDYYDYIKDTVTINQLVPSLLSGFEVDWTYIENPNLDTIFRSGLKFDNNFLLKSLYNIGINYGVQVVFNSINRTFYYDLSDNLGEWLGLSFEYGKYLKSIQKNENITDMITRMRGLGKDGLTLNAETVTGQNYVENYDFFLGSFEYDFEEEEVITSSEWMSDELATALVEYEALQDDLTPAWESAVDSLDIAIEELAILENELSVLQIGKSVNENGIDDSNMVVATNEGTIDNSVVLSEYPLLKSNGIGDVYLIDINNNIIKIFEFTDQVTADQPDAGKYTTGIYLTSSTNGNKLLKFNTADVDNGDLTSVNYTVVGLRQIDDLLQAYSSNNVPVGDGSSNGIYDSQIASLVTAQNDKNIEIEAKETEISDKELEIDGYSETINAIYAELDESNNFTTSELIEWGKYIKEGVYQNNNIEDGDLLLDSTLEALSKKGLPEVLLSIDSISILQSIDSKVDWNNIGLFDLVKIRFERFNIDTTAQIKEISMDLDSYALSFVISNVNDYLRNETDLFVRFLDVGMSNSQNVVTQEQGWDRGATADDKVDEVIESPVDTDDNPVVSGINNSVEINDNGVDVKRNVLIDVSTNLPVDNDGTDPDESYKVQITNGGIVIVKELSGGGKEYKVAITGNGVVAEVIKGNLLVGNELLILGNDGTDNIITGGTISVDAPDDDFGFLIEGVVDGNNVKVITSRDNGFRIDRETVTPGVFETMFKVNSDGQVEAREFVIRDENNEILLSNTKVIQSLSDSVLFDELLITTLSRRVFIPQGSTGIRGITGKAIVSGAANINNGTVRFVLRDFVTGGTLQTGDPIIVAPIAIPEYVAIEQEFTITVGQERDIYIMTLQYLDGDNILVDEFNIASQIYTSLEY